MLTADDAREQNAFIARFDPADMFNAEGALLHVKDMPRHVRCALRSLKVVRKNLTSGDGVMDTTLEVQFWDKGAAIEREYKHFGFWKRGARVCANNLLARLDVLDTEVLATLQDDAFRPAVVEEAIRLALEELSPAQSDKTRAKLETDRRAARLECDRLAGAIEQGGPLNTLLERLQASQGRLDAIEGQLRQADARRVHDVDLGSLEGRLRAKLADWRGLLHRNIAEGRAVLRTLLVGPLRFTPVKDGRRVGYAFEGAIALDRLLSGVVELPTVVASPGGTERSWTREIPGKVKAA